MRRIAIIVAVVVFATVFTVVPAGAHHGTTTADGVRPTAVVTMGDSYISGEAGRWAGNWRSSWGNRKGTDRAAYKRWGFWFYDAERVYGSTDNTGCHRSDVAPVNSADFDVDVRINLACSGARTNNIFRAANGGRTRKGEAPQADQLASVAATHDVEIVVLSVGGNDLGFAGIIIDCTVDYLTSPSWWRNTCRREKQRSVDARMDAAMAGVGTAIDEIRAVMSASGHTDSEYRLVLQSYPSPVPRGSEFRHGQFGKRRATTGGCPFWNVDATWARDALVPQISDNLAAVAASRDVEFLDLSDAFEGREVCSEHASQGTGDDAEWARFVTTGVFQGESQESMHPNAYGQEAIGTCLTLLAAAVAGHHECTNVAGEGPDVMDLRPVAVPVANSSS